MKNSVVLSVIKERYVVCIFQVFGALDRNPRKHCQGEELLGKVLKSGLYSLVVVSAVRMLKKSKRN